MPDRPTQILEAAARLIARRGVRGLRVEEVSAEAAVSTALIYYHFKDRAGLLRRTLEFISQRAVRYTDAALETSDDPRVQLLLLELQDVPQVKENSAAWGELRATAVFDPDLRELLAAATRDWVEDLAGLIRQVQEAGAGGVGADPYAAAERLTALAEGLSERWLSGTTSLQRAHELLRGAVETELGPA
ncbi:TetR/AcrR family transcriptional regulator [Streptomyces tubercidicus]|uniref:TetR/AcrR family transcriptional regulator n=1 Tax=Streptomyces tubercidicus TaxID=47759 RepID=UPI002E180101|nr:TetR/AcrR family transcriptional regulator [Streptomyces tubercidicus]